MEQRGDNYFRCDQHTIVVGGFRHLVHGAHCSGWMVWPWVKPLSANALTGWA